MKRSVLQIIRMKFLFLRKTLALNFTLILKNLPGFLRKQSGLRTIQYAALVIFFARGCLKREEHFGFFWNLSQFPLLKEFLKHSRFAGKDRKSLSAGAHYELFALKHRVRLFFEHVRFLQLFLLNSLGLFFIMIRGADLYFFLERQRTNSLFLCAFRIPVLFRNS